MLKIICVVEMASVVTLLANPFQEWVSARGCKLAKIFCSAASSIIYEIAKSTHISDCLQKLKPLKEAMPFYFQLFLNIAKLSLEKGLKT
jgi:hypothetical protein